MMDQGPISSRGVEGRDSCSSCPDPFSKGSLKKERNRVVEQWNSNFPNLQEEQNWFKKSEILRK